MANSTSCHVLPMARTDGRTNERVSHLPETSSVTHRARENRMNLTPNEREAIEFFDRVKERARKSHAWQRRNAYVPTVAETRIRNYDQETERLRAAMTERKAS